MNTVPAPVRAWHDVVHSLDPVALDALLADEIVFRSPAVHTPQVGRELANAYLNAAMVVLGPTLTYHRQWWTDESAVLEFTCTLDGLDVHGVDMLAWNPEGRLTDFTVMIRPHKALQKVIELMAAELIKP